MSAAHLLWAGGAQSCECVREVEAPGRPRPCLAPGAPLCPARRRCGRQLGGVGRLRDRRQQRASSDAGGAPRPSGHLRLRGRLRLWGAALLLLPAQRVAL
jgi:hypothetical protein